MWEFSVQNIHASCNQMVIFSKGVPKVSTSGSSPIFFMKLEETYKQAPHHLGHSERVTDSLIVNACLEIPPPLPPTHTHTHTHTLISMTPPFLINCKIITRTISEHTIFEYGNQLNRNDTDPSTREKREDYETVPEFTGEVISLHKETKPIN